MIETSSAQLTEVVVPAVSYRMGVSRRWDVKKEEITGTKKKKTKTREHFLRSCQVPDMAFGVASISRDGTVTYANLWLPKR